MDTMNERRLPVVVPQTRADCLPGGSNEARPCQFRACRHNLANAESSCVLDIVDDRGALSLEEIGDLLGLTRERIRQIESVSLFKIYRHRFMRDVSGASLSPVSRTPPKDLALRVGGPENWRSRSVRGTYRGGSDDT